MSGPPNVRRADKLMPAERTQDMLERGFCGRLATVGADGYPYCVPLLYVWMDGQVFVHNTSARGHLRTNVEHDSRACFEVDEPGAVFSYGRFECDSSVAYRSIVVFGKVRIIEDGHTKQRFCEALMAKYAAGGSGRPPAFYPRLNMITVYAISVERMTGKETALPEMSQRWPLVDGTKTPWAQAPGQVPENQAAWAERLRALPVTVRAIAEAVDDATLRVRPAPGEWSAIEVVGHLIDKVQFWHERVERIRQQDRPMLPGYDQDQYVRERGYQTADLSRLMTTLSDSAAEFARTVAAVPDAALTREGVHADMGPLTLRQCITLPLDSASDHLAQMRAALTSALLRP